MKLDEVFCIQEDTAIKHPGHYDTPKKLGAK